MKHSKYKNILILHEMLINQITDEIIDNKQGKAINIYQKYFSSSSPLKQELKLFKTLYNPNYRVIAGDKNKAKDLVQTVIQRYNKLDKKIINTKKYNLIAELKNNYDLQRLLKKRIEDYSVNASIYKLLQSNDSEPQQIIQNKYVVIQHIIKKTGQVQLVKQNIIKQKKQSTKQLVQNFNNKYSLILNDDQKNVLRKYILQRKSKNFTPYMNKHINKVKFLLQQNLKKLEDQVKKIKIKQIISQLTILQNKNILKKQNIFALIYGYELIKNIQK